MKSHILKLLVFLITFNSFAQQGIGTNRPDPSSVLDVSSSNKGFLIPRMTTLQREAIINTLSLDRKLKSMTIIKI